MEQEMDNLDTLIPSPLDHDEKLPNTLFYHSWGMSRSKPSDIRSGRDIESQKRFRPEEYESPNFGTFNGVYMRCILSILSAVFYLRLGWVVGNCGLVMALVLILINGVATILTTLSLSAVATNGLVKGGGVYYFISRSLGADWGGTVGVVFSFATTFSAVLHVFSFVDVVQAWNEAPVTKDGKWDYPLIGIALALFLLIIICISLKIEVKLEYVLTALIGASMIGFLFGQIIPGTPRWKISNIKNNLWASYLPGESFFTVFAVFFPGCTGIMAGANISGDLADPQRSIPIGTLGAIVTTTLLNMVTAVILSSAADKEELLHNYTIMSDMSLWGPLVYLGIIGAAISSASAAMIGGPKTFQSLCNDKILPKIFDFFAVGKQSTNDPVRGFILGFLIVAISSFIFHDLNTVSTILTNFFLISFALICAACFVGSMSKSPSWRPSWKYHHPILDVIGAAFMIVAMFLIDWVMSLGTVGVCLVVLGYFHWSNTANNNWGEFPQSLLFTDTVDKIGKLDRMPEHVKTYRPQIEYVIDYTNNNVDRQYNNIIPFKQMNEKAYSILGVSLIGENCPEEEPQDLTNVFFHIWGNIDPQICPKLLSKAVGYGKIKPNVLATHFRITDDFFDLICGAADVNLGILVSRNFETFDTNVENHYPIDIWWLMDDGGLTLLTGYILSTHEAWKNCPIRLYTVLPKTYSITNVQLKLSKLIHLLRIQAEINVLSGIEDDPKEETISLWNEGNIRPETPADVNNVHVFLRLRELIMEKSRNSSLIISTMPLPKVTMTPNVWVNLINFVSESMPPFIWVHGNNENVVTFSA